jgi:hypothetical protein
MSSVTIVTSAALQKLKSDNAMPGLDRQQANQAIAASSFKLRLDQPGQLSPIDVVRLLQHARASRDYQAHGENYQLRLKTDQQGEYLSLKKQGLWSRFLGAFGVGHERRVQERAAAINLINRTLEPTGFSIPREGNDPTHVRDPKSNVFRVHPGNDSESLRWVDVGAVSFTQAQTYQTKLMTMSNIKTQEEVKGNARLAGLSDSVENPYDLFNTEPQPYVDDSRAPSAVHVFDDQSEQQVSPLQQPLVENEYDRVRSDRVNSFELPSDVALQDRSSARVGLFMMIAENE